MTNGTLTIAGSQTADRIALRLSADASQLQVDVGDDGSADATFGLDTFRAIDVEAGNGDDTVRIDGIHGNFTTTKPRGSTVRTETTPSSAAVATRPSWAVAATTSSTATAAPTRRSSARAMTRSSGIRATARTSSRARAAWTP